MAFPVGFWILLGGVPLVVIASALWWKVQTDRRAIREAKALKQNSPAVRDGHLTAALVLEIIVPGLEIKGKNNKSPAWMSEVSEKLDEIAKESGLKPVGSFHTTYMVVSTNDKVANSSLRRIAKAGLAMRDAVQLFSAMHDLAAATKIGIHADLIPSSGVGSTVSLSGLWSLTLNLADRANLNTIELSDQAAEWLGTDFDIRKMEDKPVLFGTKVA